MSYSIMSHYLIRSPLLPIERRNKVKGASSFEGKVAFLEDVLDDEVFVEAIEWGSPALYSQVCKFRDGCNRNDETSIDKLYYSVLKYYLRALYRATPYGLFSGIDIGEIGDCDSVVRVSQKIEQSESNRQKTLTLEQKLQLQGESFSELSKLYTENRKTAHDFRAHLDMLSSLLENGETTEASRYLNNIRTKQTTRIFLVNCHHPVLDALLNQKARLAQEKRIDIRFKVNDLSALTIDPTDITVILSNLLDNAIEASEKCDNKQIEVRVLLENSFFFSIRNTSLPVHIINNHITSTKSDRSLHGFGLENVKTLLVKHNGEYVMFYDNGWFQFSAEIPTEFIS